MSYLFLRTCRTPGVLAIVPMFIPCRSNTHDASPGFVATLMSCDVPSRMLMQPDTPTPATMMARICLTFMIGAPRRHLVFNLPTACTAGNKRRTQKWRPTPIPFGLTQSILNLLDMPDYEDLFRKDLSRDSRGGRSLPENP